MNNHAHHHRDRRPRLDDTLRATRTLGRAPLAAALTAALLPFAAGAQAAEPERLPLWELGVLGLTASQQAYPGASQQTECTLLLPYGIYRGRYFRADRNTVGLRAVKTPRFALDVGFAGSLGSDSDRIDARSGMPDLGTLVEAGPRLRWNLGTDAQGGRWRADFALRAVLDLSDRLAYKGWAFEPELDYERRSAGGWRWGASAGLVFGDRRLGDTLYGVAPDYATPERPAYDARSGLVTWRLSANASTALTRDLRLFGFVRLDSVNAAANRESPLVRERNGGSVGIGLAYTFKRSAAAAYD